MSPEGIAYGIEEYVQALKRQVVVAEAFFNGRITQGIEGLLALPEKVRLRIDQLIWISAGGVAVDPTDEASRKLVTEAILFSLEERMGMHA